jgi:hypothetical protein
MPDCGDPEVYIAGAVAILAAYPEEVINALADPVSGTRYLKDRPSLRQLRDACDRLNEPFEREQKRRAAHESDQAFAPPLPLTAEEHAKRAEKVAAVRRELGIPPGGLPNRGNQVRELPQMSFSRRERLQADLAARKARNHERDGLMNEMTRDDSSTER